jgi:hypothetical protein
MSNNFYSLNFLSGSYRLELGVHSLNGNYSLIFPGDPPVNETTLKWNSSLGRFVWAPLSVGGGGTVTSVGLALTTEADAFLTVNNSPIVNSGTLQIDVDSQAANLIFASPNNAAGKPTFRTMVDGDLPAQIGATRINGVLNRNNIPNGTQASSWQLGTGFQIINDTSGIKIVASDGTTTADLTCANLNVTGNINQSNVNELNVQDQWINLLNGFNTGTPSLNGGVKFRRGSQLWSHVEWSESLKRWLVGISNNLKPIARTAYVDITNANITGGAYTFMHNLEAERYPTIIVANNQGEIVNLGVTHSNANSAVIRFDRVGAIVGTWTITAIAG